MPSGDVTQGDVITKSTTAVNIPDVTERGNPVSFRGKPLEGLCDMWGNGAETS